MPEYVHPGPDLPNKAQQPLAASPVLETNPVQNAIGRVVGHQHINLPGVLLHHLLPDVREEVEVPAEELRALGEGQDAESLHHNQLVLEKVAHLAEGLPLLVDILLGLLTLAVLAEDVVVVAGNDHLFESLNALQHFLKVFQLLLPALLCEVARVDQDVGMGKLPSFLDG